ncbi:DEAD/DEAH box helicase [Candidatus Woesebacteria bacterium]|nr:DEAD/DEAH box helicase [Candidatus Woesebacteria bacterium]
MSRREFSARGSRPQGFNRNPRFAGGRASTGRSQGGFGRGGNRIKYMSVDPRILVKKGTKLEQTPYESKHQFSDFPFSTIIQENIVRKKYVTPTPIQDQVIPVVMEGRDVIGLAATGTGKTAAFMLPLLNKIMRVKTERVLIMAPTRELAVQIVEEGGEFARGSGINYALIIGGVDMRGQIRDLSRKPSLVVGTPGRLKDLMERRALRMSDYQTIVLDEVDRMLDMGFIDDMRTIIGQLPKERHGLFFSATMNDKAQIIAREFLNNPVTIQIETQHASEAVDQDIVKLNGRSKIEVLHELLIQPGFDKVLVFGRTKHGMEKLSKTLTERGFATASIHGNKSQSQRQRALTAFKRNEVKVLLATDVAARGIDIDSVTHVINFELPETYADYIHRIGRTGRADRTGVALTFID